jgi:O-antigen ligase
MNNKKTSSLDTLCRLTGFLFLTLIPLTALIPVAHPPYWWTEDLILRWVSVLTLLFCTFRYWQKTQSGSIWDLGLADVVLILLSIWTLLSASNSSQSFDSFYALRNLWVVTLFWFALRGLWEMQPDLYPRFTRVFWGTSVLAAAWVSLSTLGQSIWPASFVWIFPRQGFFTNSNIAAGYLGMALVVALLKMIRQEKVNLIAFLVVLTGWAVTQSRGAFLALVVVIVIFALLNTRELEQTLSRWKSNQWVKFMLLVFVLACASVPMVNRLFHALDIDPRAYFRVEIWRSALHMVMAQPLWGFGPGTFGDIYPIYRSGFLWNTATDVAHNEYLQVAAECGIPALILTLLLLWSLLMRFQKSFSSVSIFKPIAAQAQAAEFAFYIILFEAVHDFVDYTLHDWAHRLILLGFVTYALKKNNPQEDLKISLRLSRRTQIAAVAALFFIAIWSLGMGSFKDYMSRIYELKSTVEFQASDLGAAEIDARKSLDCRKNNINSWNLLGTIDDAKASLTKLPADREKLFSQAKAEFDQAISLSPFSLGVEENEAGDLLKSGRVQDAIDLEKRMIAKVPEDPSHYLALATILTKFHREKEALVPVQQALDIDDYFVPACLLKAQILEALGRKQEALKTYQKAQSILEQLHLKDPSGQLDIHVRQLQSEF